MIQLSNVSKSFGPIQAVQNVHLNIAPGSILGLIGSNGSGKSTLMRLFTGIYQPDEGTITVGDIPVFNRPEATRQIFFIADDLYMPPGSTILDLINFYEPYYPRFDRNHALKLAEVLDLKPAAKLSSLSKGMLRQAFILVGIAANTRYLIMDETFDGLDPVKRQAVKRFLADFIADGEKSVVISSHNLRELEDICDHIAFLHKGQLVLDRSLEDLSEHIYNVQCAFETAKTADDFSALTPQHVHIRGRMIQMIVRGEYDHIQAQINAMQPLYLDILPLTLEEVFITEMEVLGYDVNQLIL